MNDSAKKCCTGCKAEKPLSAFGRRATTRDKKRSQCLECERARAAQIRIDHPERLAAAQRRYYEKNRKRLIEVASARNEANKEHLAAISRERRWIRDWMTALVNHAKHAARAKGREFTITRADVERLFEQQDGRCYWLDIPFVFEIEAKHPQRPSIDRLDPTRGYTPDNIVLACIFANIGRGALSAERFADFLSDTGLRQRKSLAA